MKKLLIAIDPGWSGALAVWPEGVIGYPQTYECPSDLLGMWKLFTGEVILKFPYKVGEAIWDYRAVMERVWWIPKWGNRGLPILQNKHYWEAILARFQIPLVEVTAKRWQKIAQAERGDTKAQAWRYARKQFPHLAEQLGEKPPTKTRGKSGASDALCVLAWLMEKGGSQ